MNVCQLKVVENGGIESIGLILFDLEIGKQPIGQARTRWARTRALSSVHGTRISVAGVGSRAPMFFKWRKDCSGCVGEAGQSAIHVRSEIHNDLRI